MEGFDPLGPSFFEAMDLSTPELEGLLFSCMFRFFVTVDL